MTWLSLNTSNLTLQTHVTREKSRDEHLARIEIALLSIIFLIATVLNSALLMVLWKRRKQLSRMRVFVFHLCLADLVVAFFQVYPQLMWDITDRFIGPDVVCRLVKYLQVVGMFASTYMIVVMTIDRYQAVCNPMATFQRRRASCNVPVCAAWTVSLIGGIPQIFIFSKVQVAPGVFDCWADFIKPWGLKTYVTWTTLVIFVLPIFTVIVCQVRICRVVQINLYHKTHHEINVPNIHPPSSSASGITGLSKARMKTVKMTVVIVLVYVICWAPFFTVQLWSAWDVNAPTETAAFTILMLLSSLNSCANPCIYLVLSSQMPKRLIAALCSPLHRMKESTPKDAAALSSIYMSFKSFSDSK